MHNYMPSIDPFILKGQAAEAHDYETTNPLLCLLLTTIVVLFPLISRLNQCYWEWNDCLTL